MVSPLQLTILSSGYTMGDFEGSDQDRDRMYLLFTMSAEKAKLHRLNVDCVMFRACCNWY